MLALILVQVAFTDAKPVDFWGTKALAQARPPAAAWAEGARPAAPVADLIEHPTVENARRYLDWQKDRLDRLEKAFAALEEARRADAPPSTEILYFTREGCAWCRKQDEVLASMKLPVRRVTPEDPGPWKRHQVSATPTLVIPGRPALRGFQTRHQIEEALR